MSADNKTLIRRFGEELWNAGNLRRADEFLAPHVVSHFTHLPSPTNREGFLTFVTQLRDAFPDLAFTLEDLIAEHDKVVARWTMRGTHHGLLLGIPPTGKPIRISATIIYRIANGKIAELWGNVDVLSLAQQIGMVTPPPFSDQPPAD